MGTSSVTWLFVGLIAIVAVLSVGSGMVRRQPNAVATLLTVIGVLGTFVGVWMGLRGFDETNIAASIPALLAGLKTAFVTSIAGMVAAISVKAWSLVEAARRSDTTGRATGATIDDLAQLLTRIDENQVQASERAEQSLRAIEAALVGEGDSTIASQLERLRLRIIEHQDGVMVQVNVLVEHTETQIGNQQHLLQAFRDFAAEMTENNMQALVQALEEVMRRFNVLIAEQFGENFKHLNEAVGQLLSWQSQYRDQMQELAEQMGLAAQHIEASRQSIQVVAESSASIVSAADRLGPVLTAIQSQLDSLEAYLAAFQSLREQAQEAFPIIEQRLNVLTTEFSGSVQTAIDTSERSVQEQTEAIRRQSERLSEALEETQTGIRRTSAALQEEVQGLIEQVGEKLAGQIVELDQALGEELTRSLTMLGGQLTALSRAFVDDYRPLTESLQKLVSMAEGRES